MDSGHAPDVDFSPVAEMGDGILPILNTIREAEPIAWNDSLSGWVLTRHEDVIAAFQGQKPLSCVRNEARAFGTMTPEDVVGRWPAIATTIPNWIVNSDAPRHTRLRTLMSKAFGRSVVEGIRPFARATIAKVLGDLEGRDEVELVEEVARQITGRVILNIFGVDDSYLARLRRWSISINEALGGLQPSLEKLDDAEVCMREMNELFSQEIAKRRANPDGDDFLSLLIRAREGNDQLSEDEILGNCSLVIVAGHDTTMNSMVLGVRALIRNPEARRYLLEHPERIGDSVMEMMRFVAMSNATNRIAMEDFEWHGKQIRKGEQIWMMIAGANRDPRVFENPETLDLTRPTDKVAVFAPGIHHCIGHLLAKMQLSEFWPAFFTRFPNVQIIGDDKDFTAAFTFRGLTHLHIRLR